MAVRTWKIPSGCPSSVDANNRVPMLAVNAPKKLGHSGHMSDCRKPIRREIGAILAEDT
jgi:hypothetical protein